MKLYVGIDHGFKGGIVAVDNQGRIVNQFSMPILTKKNGRDGYDLDAITNLFCSFEERRAVICAERQQPLPAKMGGSQANFARGAALMWEALARAHKLAFLNPRPQDWQKDMLPTGEGDTKQRALLAAAAIWPGFTFVQPGKRKAHDGIIDAALLAEWARRKQA